jgi:hypothetical protein
LSPKLPLVEAILRMQAMVPDPPCLECSWKKYCTINEVACQNFRAYTNEGRWFRGNGVNEPWPKHAEKPNLKLGVHPDV